MPRGGQEDQYAKGSEGLEGKVQSGIAGLDVLISGGFEPQSTVLVMGEAGTGKTTFLSQFIHNGATEYGEPGVLVCFEENSESVTRHMEKFGFDFAALENSGQFSAINYRPHEVKKLVEEGGGLILDTISSIGAKRLAVDSLTSYVALFETAYQAREAENELFDFIRKLGCTAMLSAEGLPSRTKAGATPGMEHLVDTLLLLHHPRKAQTRIRALEVVKMRGTKQAEQLCPFEMKDGEGIKVYPDQQVFFDLRGKDD